MKLLVPLMMAFAFLLAPSCQSSSKNDKKSQENDNSQETAKADLPQDLSEYDTAYFASGCFWCVEAIFESVRGVAEVVSGYAGGKEENPTYEAVSYGRTTHAEAVKVYYDKEKVSFQELVQVFFGSHDPTTLNRQGPDRGPQYRSIAFYQNESEKAFIEQYIKALEENKVYDQPIVTEVEPLEKFYKAEEYHQDYEHKNPDNSYIRNVSIPRLNRFKQNFPGYLKEKSGSEPH
ncbi:peptide-methionine (S)-S-oxide reductase MsrA [Zeaxanthinibacter enoshimensis]|uniref:Peptide methionine sulfoxide reductase MsrA n=1 Tax=Zeaxanthinibacter enoshimensis TaxID=392009 RepID=A0A4R6TME8_9FLAO|nr:peptide-methionine (S)-S-oxide reductase MsrA [Zeaxanthinibacter enoshimensis]TDQ29271.1 peptide-methionine (S)-S-oxide reductase [Zeaxanthinibacter enoshimensis]